MPAIAKVYPALCSQFVLMMLASSICSAISTHELAASAAFVESQTYRSFEVYIVVTLIYLALALRCVPVSRSSACGFSAGVSPGAR